MICFDTNIIIYIANGTLGENIVSNKPTYYASTAKIEALGHHNIKSIEEQRVRELLSTLIELPLDKAVVELAINLRQAKSMSLGDAIMAATALEHNCQLWTANTKDFSHITGLKLNNPLEKL